MHAILQTVDAVVTPGGAKPAVKFDDYVATSAAPTPISFTGPFNLYGGPALVVPAGFTQGGLPVGLQIAGRAFDEPSVLRIGAAYQHTTDWHTRAPAVSTEGALV
jgi:aspartyl-tRNA(Asn)/glutamyl-tRNA(Gln) amidotransferase subunit A